MTIRRRMAGEARFALDRKVFRQDASDVLQLSGWCVHRRLEIARVVLKRNGDRLGEGTLSIHRPRVAAEFSATANAERAGFDFTMPGPGPGDYTLHAEAANGPSECLAEILLAESERPGLLFMHIPKAAGSTVNAYFSEHFAADRSRVHIESEPGWRTDPKSLERYDFLSGHVTLPTLRRRLEISRYLLVTVVREPFAQLISHLAWIRRLSDAGEERRLARHPEYIQAFSAKLAGLDLGSVKVLGRLIDSLEPVERKLVENCQVRYFTHVEGERVTRTDLQAAERAAGCFDHIGLAEEIDDFFARVAREMGWPPPEMPPRENVTSKFYGLANPGLRVRRALRPLVRYDTELYEYLRRKRRS